MKMELSIVNFHSLDTLWNWSKHLVGSLFIIFIWISKDHLDVESHIVGNHIVHSFEKGGLGIDYDSMAAMGMWFHRMAIMDIGYNFGNCDHRIDFGGRKRVDHLFEIVDHFAYLDVYASKSPIRAYLQGNVLVQYCNNNTVAFQRTHMVNPLSDLTHNPFPSMIVDDSGLHLTLVLRRSGSTHFEPTPSTQNTVRIIPGPTGIVQQATPSGYCPNPVRIIPGPMCIVQQATPSGYCPNPVRIIPGPMCIVQQAKMLKEKVFILDSDRALMLTQEYMQKVVEDVAEDDDFNSGAWVSATNYVISNGGSVAGCLGDIKNFLKRRKLDQVVAIVKSCSLNVLGDLTVTMKDLSDTIPRTSTSQSYW
uniref:Uncharacterized protein n=1 Tax=Tanacetum cinerariifolium TaxID=118510 RepID=A0A699HA73_TANCI|nr:hypothetical protein [Tanacetum cinerariifolium]